MKSLKHNSGILFFLITVLSFSCKKKAEDTVAVKDCEKNSYGIVTVHYTNSTLRHSILITYPGSPSYARDKIAAKGVLSDTVHLPQGNYTLSISSIDDVGASIDSNNESAIIYVCTEKTFTEIF